ncbi:hypothetical protein ATN84_10975 [Paramesorhizobium deserti]|uniref:Sulfotransferase domain-containing protein n=2 Tax=Paramesorhizobium deserti TaxID=1494590 RepID=A0A135HTP9_9HYPH|nr:hypothetical protein ATN84_10975 [Paramesorhizobium deserti]
MHRSGTSALTRVLNLVGCDLPKTVMPAHPTNETGHWEPTPIAQLNDRILTSAGTKWDDWLEFTSHQLNSSQIDRFREEAIATLEQEFGDSRLFVLKEPRICRLAPFWIETLQHAGIRPLVITPVRNPLEVAASLQKRNGFDPSYGHLLWLRHMLDAEFTSRGVSRYFTSYDRLLTVWSAVLKDAESTLEISWPRMSGEASMEIDAFLSERYRHHKETPERVLENPALSTWLRETFTIFDRWARSREQPEDFAALDQLRGELNAAAPAFADLIARGREADLKTRKLAEANAQLSQMENSLEQHRYETKRATAELTSAREELNRITVHRGEMEKLAEGFKEHTELLLADLRERRKLENASHLQLKDREEALLIVQKQMAEATEALVLTRTQATEAQSSVDALRKDLAAQRQSHAQEIERMTRETAKIRNENDNEIRKLKAEIERAKAERDKLQTRLKERFEEITTLTRLLQQHEQRTNRFSQIRQLPGTTRRIVRAAGKRRHWANLWHRIRYAGALGRLERSGIFDENWYLSENPDVSARGVDPALHYIRFGAAEGRQPSATAAPGQLA